MFEPVINIHKSQRPHWAVLRLGFSMNITVPISSQRPHWAVLRLGVLVRFLPGQKVTTTALGGPPFGQWVKENVLPKMSQRPHWAVLRLGLHVECGASLNRHNDRTGRSSVWDIQTYGNYIQHVTTTALGGPPFGSGPFGWHKKSHNDRTGRSSVWGGQVCAEARLVSQRPHWAVLRLGT